MFSKDKVIALYCRVDDLPRERRHYEDAKLKVGDSEVIDHRFCFGSKVPMDAGYTAYFAEEVL